MIHVNDVRSQYPEPVSEDDTSNGYCVGGALCLYMDFTSRHIDNNIKGSGQMNFPTEKQLQAALLKANQDLSPEQASDYAEGIITLNDAERIEDAWGKLSEALNYVESKVEVDIENGSKLPPKVVRP
jgi:hypothetical protein